MSNHWNQIYPAINEIVVVRTSGGAEFMARRKWVSYGGDDGEDSVTWEALPGERHPPCWSGGLCWGSNEDEEQSDPVTHWRTLTPREHGGGGKKRRKRPTVGEAQVGGGLAP